MAAEISELQGAVQIITAQLTAIATRLDSIATSGGNTSEKLAQLRRETDDALKDAGVILGKSDRPTNRLQLVSHKDLKPIYFGKKEDLPIRQWMTKTKNMLNRSCITIREAMSIAESKDTPITIAEIQSSDWDEGGQGNSALHDYLLVATSGEAHTIVGTVPGNGLEAWRLLSKRFDPRGGQHDLDRFQQLTQNIQRCTVDQLSKQNMDRTLEVEHFESRAKTLRIDEGTRTCVLLKMLPLKYEQEMKYKYNAGERPNVLCGKPSKATTAHTNGR